METHVVMKLGRSDRGGLPNRSPEHSFFGVGGLILPNGLQNENLKGLVASGRRDRSSGRHQPHHQLHFYDPTVTDPWFLDTQGFRERALAAPVLVLASAGRIQKEDMGGCQNDGLFLTPDYKTAPSISGAQNRTIILTTTHVRLYRRGQQIRTGFEGKLCGDQRRRGGERDC